MKLFIHKFSLLLSSILSIFMLISADTTTLDKVDISSIDNAIIEEEIIDNNLVEESVIEELHEEKEIKEEVVEDTKENNSTTSTSKSSITSNNISSNNANNNIEQNTISSSTTSTNEVKEEIPVQENKVTNSYIGVPNPNDFYYSFHHGHIDKNYSTLDSCYQKASEVALIDTIDIINTTCYEVLDGQGTILGIYMGVKCNSGNCERYKKMVGIETN